MLGIIAEVFPTIKSWLPRYLCTVNEVHLGIPGHPYHNSHARNPRSYNGACHSRLSVRDDSRHWRCVRNCQICQGSQACQIFTTILSLGLSDSRACSLLNKSRPLPYARRTVSLLPCGYRLNRKYETTKPSNFSAMFSIMHSTVLRNS